MTRPTVSKHWWKFQQYRYINHCPTMSYLYHVTDSLNELCSRNLPAFLPSILSPPSTLEETQEASVEPVRVATTTTKNQTHSNIWQLKCIKFYTTNHKYCNSGISWVSFILLYQSQQECILYSILYLIRDRTLLIAKNSSTFYRTFKDPQNVFFRDSVVTQQC